MNTLPGRFLVLILLSLIPTNFSWAADSLESGFVNPTESAKPWTWWHWVSGNVTKEGITADLEAMKKIGLGGAQNFTVDQSQVKGPVKFMSPEWRALMQYALEEAARLHLVISIEGCDGWSESGGPWVTPAESMQKVVSTTQQVVGGKAVQIALPQPEIVRDYYEDIATFAFPTPSNSVVPPPAKVTSSDPSFDASRLIDPQGKPVDMPLKEESQWIEFEYALPVTARSAFELANVTPRYLPLLFDELQVADESGNFRKISKLTNNTYSTFPAVTAKKFRFRRGTLDKKLMDKYKGIPLVELSLGGIKLDRLKAQSGMNQSLDSNLFQDLPTTPDQIVDPKSIINLTGKKEWEAPTGNWTVVRIGHTSTGETTHPSTTPGLECNKLSSTAVQHHMGNMFGPIFEDSPESVGKTLKYVLLDSWECGCENWTSELPEEFKKRRGYDLSPWLPALTGAIIGSAEQTQRFLWDYRRTLADLLAENHYGGIQEFAHKHGMGLSSEASGIGMPTVADQLLCKKYCDIPMGEFWVNHPRDGNIDDPKEAASAAHLYGKKIAATESFTSTPNTAAWKNDPYSLKAMGDQEFCLGVNRFIFHRYAHQPWNDRKPGMSMGPWGINFERTNTWWDTGSAWISYLTRCEYLLQQGVFRADLCYFYGEGAPATVHHASLSPAVPNGYDYDVCNADVLLNLMKVKEGRITTPSGMSYRMLVLPPIDRMTLPVLKKVAALVHDGAIVYGPKPLRSPSLSGYPAADQELTKLADEVWGNCDGKTVTQHSYGAGKIFWGEPLEKALGVPPDFSTPDGDFLFIHRKAENTEIYFVSNQEQRAVTADCSFRVTGKIPELWHPDTGKRETVPLFKTNSETTTIPITFDPVGSVFVMFQKPQTSAGHPISLVITTNEKKATPTPSKLEILKATYGTGDKTVDVTSKVASMITNGTLSIHADTATLGVPDPAPNVVKQLSLEYKLNGETASKTIPEKGMLNLAMGPTFLPEASLISDSQKRTLLNTWKNGDYTVTMSDGSARNLSITNLPPPLILEGSWKLTFPPFTEGKGEPLKTTFDTLISWSDSATDIIKYFSGTATYTKSFDLPREYLVKNREIILDLGKVKNLADVTLNGKSLGILWKEPFQIDVTGSLKQEKNRLTVKVTNLWPNRLIGDQKLPEKDRTTWASFSLYKATDPLLPSGLMGPVTIRPKALVELK